MCPRLSQWCSGSRDRLLFNSVSPAGTKRHAKTEAANSSDKEGNNLSETSREAEKERKIKREFPIYMGDL